MFIVYAIYNLKNDKIYIGQTMDIVRRLKEHNEHAFRGFTSRFDGCWELIYKEELQTRTESLKREKELKSYRGRQFIKQYIPR